MEPPLPRLLTASAKAAESVAHATGVDRALDEAVEEAIVRALRSPGVERAIARVIERNAINSDDVARAIIEALHSDAADKVWADVLAGPKAQMLVERVAEAPEVRAAIASQGKGLITDIGMRLTVVTEALDDAVERLVHRDHEQETRQAGLVTRLTAAAVDVGLAVLAWSLTSSMFASVVPWAFGDRLSLGWAIALGTLGVVAAGATLVTFWALAGQTPGMRFLSIRIEPRELGLRRALRRLFALPLAILPAGLGLLAILRDPRRRGWHDRLAGTEVVYDGVRRAPHAAGAAAGPTARERAA